MDKFNCGSGHDKIQFNDIEMMVVWIDDDGDIAWRLNENWAIAQWFMDYGYKDSEPCRWMILK